MVFWVVFTFTEHERATHREMTGELRVPEGAQRNPTFFSQTGMKRGWLHGHIETSVRYFKKWVQSSVNSELCFYAINIYLVC